MKERMPFIIDIAIGVMLIAVGLVMRVDYYDTMVLSAGFGLVSAGLVHLLRVIYWQAPQRQEEYLQAVFADEGGAHCLSDHAGGSVCGGAGSGPGPGRSLGDSAGVPADGVSVGHRRCDLPRAGKADVVKFSLALPLHRDWCGAVWPGNW